LEVVIAGSGPMEGISRRRRIRTSQEFSSIIIVIVKLHVSGIVTSHVALKAMGSDSKGTR
jgi:uncharacterized membrane protein